MNNDNDDGIDNDKRRWRWWWQRRWLHVKNNNMTMPMKIPAMMDWPTAQRRIHQRRELTHWPANRSESIEYRVRDDNMASSSDILRAKSVLRFKRWQDRLHTQWVERNQSWLDGYLREMRPKRYMRELVKNRKKNLEYGEKSNTYDIWTKQTYTSSG